VDKEVLRQYHEGLICTSACLAGEIARLLTRGFYEEAKETAIAYREIFGDGNFFLEMQDHGLENQKLVNQNLLRMSRETGIPLIATNDCHYTRAEDADAHDILLCLQTGKKVSDEDRLRYEGGQYYVKSPEEMAQLFRFVPEAVRNTEKIAERCHVTITFGERKLPEYPVPAGYTALEYLTMLCEEGLRRNYEVVTEEHRSRFQKKVLYSTPMLAAYITMLIVALGIDNIPSAISQPLTMIGNITVPAALLIIGSSMSNLPLRALLGNVTVFVTALLRLAILPVGIHYLFVELGWFSPLVVNINTLVIAMPVATYGTILCLRHGKDTSLITEVTFVTTILSMITIPLLVTLLF
jgi:hypothetical protein